MSFQTRFFASLITEDLTEALLGADFISEQWRAQFTPNNTMWFTQHHEKEKG
jgi:hypothetical protein